MFHHCLRLGGGNVAWAEDAVQDVFVKLLEKLDQLAEPDDLGGWIYRVTANTCMTRLKREGSVWGRVRQALMAGESSRGAGDTPERKVELRQGARAALQALARLPARERVVFSMRYMDGLSQRDIAAAVSLSEGYVSKLLDRARHRLQRQGWEAPHG